MTHSHRYRPLETPHTRLTDMQLRTIVAKTYLTPVYYRDTRRKHY